MKIYTVDSKGVGRVYSNVVRVEGSKVVLHTTAKDFDKKTLLDGEVVVNVRRK